MTTYSQRTFSAAEKIVALVASLGTILGLLAGFVILPYRVAAVEARVTHIEENQAINREILIRMDERLKTVQRALNIPVGSP